MNPDEIYQKNVEGWGKDKTLFNVDYEEMVILLTNTLTSVVKFNYNNFDGTFYTEVQYKGGKFAISHTKKFKNGH
jgi:hypothetical protein